MSNKGPMSLDEIKKVELNILLYIDKVCKDNSLTYYLDSGTLLGAVRHKGFIPWDDDIDITMKRKDYYKLIEILKNDPKYPIISYEVNDNYYLAHAKVYDKRTYIKEKTHVNNRIEYGLFVDVFPIDNQPNNSLKRLLYCNNVRFAKAKWSAIAFENDGSVKNNMYYFLAKKHNMKWHLENITNKASKYDNLKTKYCAEIIATANPYRKVRSNVFNDTTNVEFEGHMFPAPEKYDEYLTDLYGDYMKLPPVDQRVTNHTFDAFWK